MKETMERRIIKSEAQGEIQLNCTLLEKPDARGLCVLFPGKGYTVDKPLLYYSTRLAMQKGYNLLLLSYGEFTLNDTTRHAMKNLIRGVIDEVRAEEAYQGDLVFITKSVGALFASDTARILEDTPRRSVYLTPIDQMMDNLAGMDFLAFTGSQDHLLDHDRALALLGEDAHRLRIFPGADHSLNAPGIRDSLHILQEVLQAIGDFIGP